MADQSKLLYPHACMGNELLYLFATEPMGKLADDLCFVLNDQIAQPIDKCLPILVVIDNLASFDPP